MNKVGEIFSEISDLNLVVAIEEIQEADDTGFFSDTSTVRHYTEVAMEYTNNPFATELLMTQLSFLKEAAYRWKSNQGETNSFSLDNIKTQ